MADCGFWSKEGFSPPADDDPDDPSVDFRGELRSNETHANTMDPEARLLCKGQGKEARLAFLGRSLVENRHGLPMDFIVCQVSGTLGAVRGYDTQGCVGDIRARRVTPQVARKKKHSTVDGRTTRHDGYAVSLCIRRWRRSSAG